MMDEHLTPSFSLSHYLLLPWFLSASPILLGNVMERLFAVIRGNATFNQTRSQLPPDILFMSGLTRDKHTAGGCNQQEVSLILASVKALRTLFRLITPALHHLRAHLPPRACLTRLLSKLIFFIPKTMNL